MASNPNTPISGVILHSPLSSGSRIVDPYQTKTFKQDFFPIVEMVKFINSPTLIIHGKRDEEIPIYHAKLVHKFCKNSVKPLWV